MGIARQHRPESLPADVALSLVRAERAKRALPPETVEALRQACMATLNIGVGPVRNRYVPPEQRDPSVAAKVRRAVASSTTWQDAAAKAGFTMKVFRPMCQRLGLSVKR